MINFDEFVDGVSVHLGNADTSSVPHMAIIFAVRQAVKRFCDESLSYIVKAFNTVDADIGYVPALSDIEMVRLDDRCELTLPTSTHIIKVWSLSARTCRAIDLSDYTYDYPNLITLSNKRDKSDNVVVSLSINQDASECPDYIYQQYYDGILSGTIAYLQTMPNREWAMPNFAENHETKFMQAIIKARQATDKGFRKKAPVTSIPPSFM